MKDILMMILKFVIAPLIVALIIHRIFYKSSKGSHSDDVLVDNAISVIDVAIDKFGTFNKDHEPIFEAFDNLSKNQIIRLYNDFGLRWYNNISKFYGKINIGWFGFSQRYNLTEILLRELDDSQKHKLKQIHLSKGLDFPYVNSTK
jgi:hypothetical protein